MVKSQPPGQFGDDLHLGTRCLDGRHIGVQAHDGIDDLARRTRVTQVRVDLSVQAHREVARRGYGPVQVVSVSASRASAQEGGFVDLDGGSAGGLRSDTSSRKARQSGQQSRQRQVGPSGRTTR